MSSTHEDPCSILPSPDSHIQGQKDMEMCHTRDLLPSVDEAVRSTPYPLFSRLFAWLEIVFIINIRQ